MSGNRRWQEMPKEEFRREVERHLTGQETEPWEMLYFKVYKSQLTVIEKALEIAEKHPNIEQHLVDETRKKMIRHAIEKLPEKQRAAVLLHKYQELDYGEISKILNCSESALKSLLFRAYETLRVELAPLVAQQVK